MTDFTKLGWVKASPRCQAAADTVFKDQPHGMYAEADWFEVGILIEDASDDRIADFSEGRQVIFFDEVQGYTPLAFGNEEDVIASLERTA